jgi:hypothetical protein
MVTIIENIPGFGRIDANRENEASPKRLEGIFSPQRKHSHIGYQPDIASYPASICRALKARDISAMGTAHGYDNRKYSGFWPK